MRRRLDVAGRKDILGRVMISQLDNLANTVQIRRDMRVRNELIADRSLNDIDVDEELRALTSRQRYLEVTLPALDLEDTVAVNAAAQLVDQRQELLQASNDSVKVLLRSLVENNETSNNLISVTDNFHQFLVGNLMWVRNFGYINPKTFFLQVKALVSPADWAAVPSNLLRGYQRHAWSAALLFIWVLLLVLRRPLKALYEERLHQPALLNARTLGNIILGLALSLIIVALWPLMLFIAGSFLDAAQPSSNFLEALGAALNFSGSTLFVLLVARLLLSPMGVGRRLLKWDTRMLNNLRRELEWAGPVTIVALFLNVFATNLDVVTSGGPLGALTTATVSVTIMIFALRLQWQDIFAGDRALRLSLRFTAFLAAVVVIMQLLGLLFAAEIYLGALCLSILMLLVIKTLTDVMKRALLILRARLERKAKEEIRALGEGEEDAGDMENQVDMVYLSEAHSKLLNLVRMIALGVVLWLIWSPTLPAFNLLESVPLWQVSGATDTGEVLRTITLFDLALSVIIIVATALIAKHLPSLVQLFLLEWVDISAGARYASGILMQYVVVAMGGSLFLTTVGWEWGNLQWLVAALGVGIGFGLQEIVANFVSGIIILFEQPIRVGDIISAGGAEGTVKKISARATVIQTFEGKEHLIPNKELITGHVINWSLTENAIRVVIPIGIAYGSDVRRALELLVETARETELVLDEPAPRATFEDFGDNALMLWLRCYVAEDRPGAWTELRTRINDKFNDEGIVIAFPQRDLHLDFSEALKVEIAGPQGGAAPAA